MADKKKKKSAAARQVTTSKKEKEHETVNPADVDLTKEGDPDLPAPRPGLVPAPAAPTEKRISSAAVVEPTAVDDEDEDDVREEKVVATRAGYYGHKRREPREVFIMYFKGKKGFLPSWVRLADDEDIETREEVVQPASKGKPAKTKEVEILDNSRPLTQGGNVVTPDVNRTVI